MSNTDSTEPTRFTVPLKPSIHQKVTREKAIGSPIRWRLGDHTMMEGVVVDWQDETDGSVTITVEASASE